MIEDPRLEPENRGELHSDYKIMANNDTQALPEDEAAPKGTLGLQEEAGSKQSQVHEFRNGPAHEGGGRGLEDIIQDKNLRIAGLEEAVRQLEAENQLLRKQRRPFLPLVLTKSTFFAKLGNTFFVLTLIVFTLHITGVMRVEQLVAQLDEILAPVLTLLERSLQAS